MVDEEEAARMGLSAIGCTPSGENVSCEGAAKNRHRDVVMKFKIILYFPRIVHDTHKSHYSIHHRCML